MKTKQGLINLLKTDVQAFNKFREENPPFEIDLSGVNLTNADLTGANLIGANLTHADLYSANLIGANLYCANLTGANLTSANLYSANLKNADLYSANLTGVNLTDADLYSATLTFANLINANLKNANLCGANLTFANLTNATLTGANLDFASWPLHCGSLKPKTDEKERVQLFFHAASLIKHAEAPTEEEIEIYNHVLKYVNKFHRADVERLEEIK